ncbi:MAG TPA: hypothetical protein ENG70_05735 [Candidatus Cloacimonetes bacterium]|nr:hypothetical protein [Candidatus Cloacimonadota bacterium]HEX38333.1 hypothetical protein [Candidatus Cloacimonadota bacterium]
MKSKFLYGILIVSIIIFASCEKKQEEKTYTIEQAHQIFAVDFFNKTWDFIEKEDRTPEEDETMLNLAHASLMHWAMVGQPINVQRGEWMVANVYTILGRPVAALHHAQNCLDLTNKFDFKDFDLAFAYEIYARALAMQGDKRWKEYYQKAKDAAAQIEKKEDREYFLQVLESEPWFGVK